MKIKINNIFKKIYIKEQNKIEKRRRSLKKNNEENEPS
jgi:hypothetical protein